MNPVCGLILAGGKSRRMGQPKESFSYNGEAEPKRMYRLLEEITNGAYFAIRPDQETWLMFSGGRAIIDAEPGGGPLAALRTAMAVRPDASWLVVPVDMPLLTKADLEKLISSRQKGWSIVAYENGTGSFEPLPAIYENTLSEAANQMFLDGRKAIRGLGDGVEIFLLKPEDETRLCNVNTPRERSRVMEAING